MQCSSAACRNELTCKLSVLSDACVSDPSHPNEKVWLNISIKFIPLDNKANWSYLEILIPAL